MTIGLKTHAYEELKMRKQVQQQIELIRVFRIYKIGYL